MYNKLKRLCSRLPSSESWLGISSSSPQNSLYPFTVSPFLSYLFSDANQSLIYFLVNTFSCFESYINEFIYSIFCLTSTFSMMLLRLLCVYRQFILFILSRILLCAYTTVCYSFSSWLHGCFSSLELLWIKLLWTFTYKSLCQYVFISYVNT